MHQLHQLVAIGKYKKHGTFHGIIRGCKNHLPTGDSNPWIVLPSGNLTGRTEGCPGMVV